MDSTRKEGNEPNDVSHEPHIENESGPENNVWRPDEMFLNNKLVDEAENQAEIRPTRTKSQPSKHKDYVVQVPPSVKHPTSTSNQVTSMIKFNPNGEVERYKARLVAKGFTQMEGVDYHDTFAPVAKLVTVRTLLAVAVKKDWIIYQNNAFLQGDLDDEADHSLFIYEAGSIMVVVLIYVDDAIITENNLIKIQETKKRLDDEFSVKDLGPSKYFLGIEVAKTSDGLVLSQRKYTLDILENSRKLGCKPNAFPIEQGLKLDKGESESRVNASQFRGFLSPTTGGLSVHLRFADIGSPGVMDHPMMLEDPSRAGHHFTRVCSEPSIPGVYASTEDEVFPLRSIHLPAAVHLTTDYQMMLMMLKEEEDKRRRGDRVPAPISVLPPVTPCYGKIDVRAQNPYHFLTIPSGCQLLLELRIDLTEGRDTIYISFHYNRVPHLHGTPPFLLFTFTYFISTFALPSHVCRAGVSEVTLPPRKRLCIALGPRYEVGKSSSAPTARHTRGFRADYGFVGTLDDEIRRDPERERMTDFVMTVRQDTYEIYGRLDDAQDDRLLMSGQLNMLYRDRRAHARTALLMEREDRLSREASGWLMDASDTARSEVRALRTTCTTCGDTKTDEYTVDIGDNTAGTARTR
ncbi:putative reverse transcriptase, RNA-dependent DNA polymerase, LTR copia-type gag-polypeptide [Tanacetum coccineum]